VKAWEKVEGAGPVVACAVHAGHDVRPEVVALLAVDDATRLREEDPHTGGWTALAPTRLVAHRSRFEVDLNRSRPQAVYLEPDDAWGLRNVFSPGGLGSAHELTGVDFAGAVVDALVAKLDQH
jgi:N-formylglutamate deformylase